MEKLVCCFEGDIKYNNYFGARKGYFGLAATLPEFGSKGLDS